MNDTPDRRFTVTYKLTVEGGLEGARHKAETICIEQTIEFPADLVHDPRIREHVFGRVERLEPVDGRTFTADISFALDCVGSDLDQLVNVIFGNISLHPGIRVERLDLPSDFTDRFFGPRFGRDGLRRLLNAHRRPLLCTACKPMGLSPGQLGELAYRYALGGIDIIKDDHGLANQPFAPFEERIAACTAAIEKANRETGGHTLYFPNVTAGHRTINRARFAAKAGAAGLLISPGLCGLDTMRAVADELGLPVMAHPALQGSFVVNPDQGISRHALFGQLNRLAGADAVIFPHHGGRFTFTPDDCRNLVSGTTTPMGNLSPVFPVPAGGMTLDRVPEILEFYGNDIIILIGGDLHRGDLVKNCRTFVNAVKA